MQSRAEKPERAKSDPAEEKVDKKVDRAPGVVTPTSSEDFRASRAYVSQLDLLQKMIDDLREIRGENLQDDGPSFVCVLPKADLFSKKHLVGPPGGLDDARNASTDVNPIEFLTPFFESLYAESIISWSADGPAESEKEQDHTQQGGTPLAYLRSRAGY
jgi:hypothetical protein